LSVINSSKETPREDETSVPVGLGPEEVPGYSESAENTSMVPGKLPALETDDGNRLRVLRASPLILISCGLVFLSLIFLLDFTARTDSRDTQAAESRTVANSPETKGAAPPRAPENLARKSAPPPEPLPSVQNTPAAPAQEAAAASSGKENEVPEKEAPAPAPTPAKSEIKAQGGEAPLPPTPQSEDGFTLQIGSYNDSTQAQEKVAKLGSVGVRAYIARVEIPRRGTWYRVQTGRFNSREEATRFGAQLRARGAVADFIITEIKAT